MVQKWARGYDVGRSGEMSLLPIRLSAPNPPATGLHQAGDLHPPSGVAPPPSQQQGGRSRWSMSNTPHVVEPCAHARCDFGSKKTWQQAIIREAQSNFNQRKTRGSGESRCGGGSSRPSFLLKTIAIGNCTHVIVKRLGQVETPVPFPWVSLFAAIPARDSRAGSRSKHQNLPHPHQASCCPLSLSLAPLLMTAAATPSASRQTAGQEIAAALPNRVFTCLQQRPLDYG